MRGHRHGLHDENVALLTSSSGGSGYNYGNRPFQDVFWSILYVCFLAGTVAIGVSSVLNRNPAFTNVITRDALNDPNSCPLKKEGVEGFHQSLFGDSGRVSPENVLLTYAAWISVSLLGGLLVGLLFLYLVRRHPGALVAFAVIIQVAVPVIFSFVMLLLGHITQSFAWAGTAGLLLLAVCLYKKQISFVTKLLAVSGTAMSETPGVVVFSVLFQTLTAAAVLVLTALTFVPVSNGQIVYNADRDTRQSKCVDTDGQTVPCCVWEVESWVGPACSFAGVTLVWTLQLFGQIRVYTISGAVAQWYWAPVNARLPGSITWTAFKSALGPSLGSLCFGSAILTLCSLLRNATESARKNARGNNLVAWLVACIASCIATLLEFLTKFATVRMAITGETFWSAGQNAFRLLTRNSMNTVGVWWLPPFILHCSCFIMASSWGVIVGFASYTLTFHDPKPATVLGVVAFLSSWLVLSFFASILLNMIDALYICYAMDRDTHSCTKLQIHEVYSCIPGAIVQQPDGGYAYGAPHQSTQPQAYPGPYSAPGYQAYPAVPAAYPGQYAAPQGQPGYPQQYPQGYPQAAPGYPGYPQVGYSGAAPSAPPGPHHHSHPTYQQPKV